MPSVEPGPKWRLESGPSSSSPEKPVGSPFRRADRGFAASTRARLAETVRRVVDAGIPLRQLTDHGTHLAVYLSDPDGNDLELAWDRPPEQWPRYGSDNADYLDRPLDLGELLAAADLPAGSRPDADRVGAAVPGRADRRALRAS